MAGTTIQLRTGALPKSRAGRKADPLNQDLVKALVKSLTDTPFIKVKDEETGKEVTRPNIAGDGNLEYPTQGKAASAGRKYAQAVAAELDQTVRVHVGDNGKNDNAKKFHWVVYRPISDAPAETSNES